MSTKRKVIDRSKPPGGGGPFTPEVIAAFKRLLEFERDPARQIRDDGGCDPDYRKACARLDMLLGFDEPWTRYSPAHVGDGVPPKRMREHERPEWDRAVEVRRQLEHAAAQSG